jgi:hypothetical protein
LEGTGLESEHIGHIHVALLVDLEAVRGDDRVESEFRSD